MIILYSSLTRPSILNSLVTTAVSSWYIASRNIGQRNYMSNRYIYYQLCIWLLIVHGFVCGKCGRGTCMVAKRIGNTYFFYHAVYVMLDKIKKRYCSRPSTIHVPRPHFPQTKPWTIMGNLCVPLEFQPQMKSVIFRHSTSLCCGVCQILHETPFLSKE
jgi:hypothetical protein